MAEDKKDCSNPALRDALEAADALKGFLGTPATDTTLGVQVGDQLQSQVGFKLPVVGLPADTEVVDLTSQLPDLSEDLDPMVSVIVPGPCGRNCCRTERLNMRLSQARNLGYEIVK